MRPPLRHRSLHPLLERLVREEEGYTLMELLTVLVFLGILLSIAVPSYLSFKDRTYQAAAKSNVRNIIPAVIEYGADNTPNSRYDPDSATSTSDSGYQNISIATLQSQYDPTLDSSKYQISWSADGSTYCAYSWVDAWTAYQAGPGRPIQTTLSSTFNPDPATCS